MYSEILTIAEGKLFGLMNSCDLDGRTGSHPLDVRGFSTMNCYLLTEDERALLIGTGYSVHEGALLAQLDELIGGRVLSLLIPRVEFAAMCNARPIADRFEVDVAYQRALIAPSLTLCASWERCFAAEAGESIKGPISKAGIKMRSGFIGMVLLLRYLP